MVFDSSSNLYVTHAVSNSVWRIEPGGAASFFVGLPVHPDGIEWGAGTDFGDYIYVTSGSEVLRVVSDGSRSVFASGFPMGADVVIDRTGNYGGLMYVSTGGQDHIYRVDSSGNMSMWTSWPGSHGGGPDDIAFDVTDGYGGKMFVASWFAQSDADISGLFSLSTTAAVNRFTPGIVTASQLAFDTGGLFDSELFAVGTGEWGGEQMIWRVGTDGGVRPFASTSSSLRSLAFGSDGAMYIAEYDLDLEQATVTRVIPEPGTVMLLGLGMLMMRRRQRN
jgi:hypothetical protein